MIVLSAQALHNRNALARLLSPNQISPPRLAEPGWACSYSHPGPRRQNRPGRRRDRFNRLPDPHGQRSLRPSFSTNANGHTPKDWVKSESNPAANLADAHFPGHCGEGCLTVLRPGCR
jgi:hypothetical protein